MRKRMESRELVDGEKGDTLPKFLPDNILQS